MNETLRLHPAVPSGTQRLTPKEGLTVGDRYVPGDVMVCVPSYTVFRGMYYLCTGIALPFPSVMPSCVV